MKKELTKSERFGRILFFCLVGVICAGFVVVSAFSIKKAYGAESAHYPNPDTQVYYGTNNYIETAQYNTVTGHTTCTVRSGLTVAYVSAYFPSAISAVATVTFTYSDETTDTFTLGTSANKTFYYQYMLGGKVLTGCTFLFINSSNGILYRPAYVVVSDNYTFHTVFATNNAYGYAYYLMNGTQQQIMNMYDQGYQAAAEGKDGYGFGYEMGYSQGKTAGESQGYTTGYAAGKEDGYDSGYLAGQQSNTTLGTEIANVGSAPIRMLKEMLNFEIFGLNFSNMALACLSVLLVIKVAKFFG